MSLLAFRPARRPASAGLLEPAPSAVSLSLKPRDHREHGGEGSACYAGSYTVDIELSAGALAQESDRGKDDGASQTGRLF